jgi:predicted DNA binding CopG/RHH family protein
MKVIIAGLIFFAIVGCSAVGTADKQASASKSEQGESTPDGLALKSQADFDSVYVKTKTNISDYKKVMLVPGTVAFKKDWLRDYNRNASVSARASEKDVTNIKERLSALVYETFKQSLLQQTDLEFVDEMAAGVLLLKPSIINLDVNAPDLVKAGRQRTYTQSSGEGTLYLEGFDSVSGDILLRVIDRAKDNESGIYEWSNRVTNTAEAKKTVERWSKKFTDLLATSTTTQQ